MPFRPSSSSSSSCSSKWDRKASLRRCRSSLNFPAPSHTPSSSSSSPLFLTLSRLPSPSPAPADVVPTSSPPSSCNRLSTCRPAFFYFLIFTCISSVIYSTWTRISLLQNEVVELRRSCKGNDVIGHDRIGVLQSQDEKSVSFFSNIDSKAVAYYAVFFTIFMPFLVYKYLDHLPRLRSLIKRTDNYEEVPPKKKLAYRVDVCFSVYPYAKLLALLVATIFLIGFGGLALYAVSDNSLAEALWLSWTFVADSGNHADRVGTGPRIVSVSIRKWILCGRERVKSLKATTC